MSAEAEGPAAADAPEPAVKRAKVEASTSGRAVDGVVNPAILEPEAVSKMAEGYQTSQPYLHCVMTEVFDAQLLRQVREEIIHNINATYKETDLFKLFQTGEP